MTRPRHPKASEMKRGMDVLLGGALLVALSPVLAIGALLVRLSMGSPVFYRQRRPGLRGALFEIVKLRTMTDREPAGVVPDEQRLTRVGRLLRITSIDEIPSLWNVLRGEMSLVGPRPLLPEYLPLYSARQIRRHEMKPGLTGWAQINGRNATAWDERLEMDVWYVENWTLPLDLRILWATIWRVLGRKGISSEGHATMPRFTGNDESD
jgi:lipopolysaccharide/colanic/teichoic acid biosynthesis glycosyltransferase